MIHQDQTMGLAAAKAELTRNSMLPLFSRNKIFRLAHLLWLVLPFEGISNWNVACCWRDGQLLHSYKGWRWRERRLAIGHSNLLFSERENNRVVTFFFEISSTNLKELWNGLLVSTKGRVHKYFDVLASVNYFQRCAFIQGYKW